MIVPSSGKNKHAVGGMERPGLRSLTGPLTHLESQPQVKTWGYLPLSLRDMLANNHPPLWIYADQLPTASVVLATVVPNRIDAVPLFAGILVEPG